MATSRLLSIKRNISPTSEQRIENDMTPKSLLTTESNPGSNMSAVKSKGRGPRYDSFQLKGNMSKTMVQTIEKEHGYIKTAVLIWKVSPYGNKQLKSNGFNKTAVNWKVTWVQQWCRQLIRAWLQQDCLHLKWNMGLRRGLPIENIICYNKTDVNWNLSTG